MSKTDPLVNVVNRRTSYSYSTPDSFVLVYDKDNPKSSIQGRAGLLAEMTSENPFVAAVFDVLCCRGNRTNQWKMSQSSIAIEAGCSLASAKRALKILEKHGCISVELEAKGLKCTYYLLDIPCRFEQRGSSGESEGVGLAGARGSSGESEGVGLTGARGSSGESDIPNYSTVTKDHTTLPGSATKNVAGKSKELPPGHNDFMGAFKAGYSRFYGNSPSKDFVRKIGKQFVKALYPEFGDMPKELFLEGIKMLWARDEDQPIWCQQIIKRFRRNVGSLGMILRTLKEEAASGRTTDEQRAELKAKARDLANKIRYDRGLDYKIDDWVHEECSLEMKMNALGRLSFFLDTIRWEETEVDRLAKKVLRDWAMNEIHERTCVEMKRLDVEDPVLWAKLIIRDNPTILPDEQGRYILPSMQKAADILKKQEANNV
jgi:hypothetical protein